jgi:hypothetical protein
MNVSAFLCTNASGCGLSFCGLSLADAIRRIIAVDRMRGSDQVLVEGEVTERDVAGWK